MPQIEVRSNERIKEQKSLPVKLKKLKPSPRRDEHEQEQEKEQQIPKPPEKEREQQRRQQQKPSDWWQETLHKKREEHLSRYKNLSSKAY